MFTKNIVYYINRLLSIEQCFTLILIYKRLSVVTNKSRKKIKQIHWRYKTYIFKYIKKPTIEYLMVKKTCV